MRFGGWRSGIVAAAIGLTALGSPSLAEASKYSTQIASLAFLVGDWVADKGHSEGGGINRGSFTIEPVAGGTALLRRDHTDVFDSKGKKLESFDPVMLIYPEDGKPRADYFDGMHPIHIPLSRLILVVRFGSKPQCKVALQPFD